VVKVVVVGFAPDLQGQAAETTLPAELPLSYAALQSGPSRG